MRLRQTLPPRTRRTQLTAVTLVARHPGMPRSTPPGRAVTSADVDDRRSPREAQPRGRELPSRPTQDGDVSRETTAVDRQHCLRIREVPLSHAATEDGMAMRGNPPVSEAPIEHSLTRRLHTREEQRPRGRQRWWTALTHRVDDAASGGDTGAAVPNGPRDVRGRHRQKAGSGASLGRDAWGSRSSAAHGQRSRDGVSASVFHVKRCREWTPLSSRSTAGWVRSEGAWRRVGERRRWSARASPASA